MATIFPFRAVHFNPEKIKQLDLVVTQPYDKIPDYLQDEYYDRHPNNIVRIIKGKDFPEDTFEENKYTRAARFFNQWFKEGILIQDPQPTIYAYYQTYKSPSGEKLTRKGFVSLFQLEDFSNGKVHAHEKTLPKPKQDRLNLLKAMNGTTFGQIFMLYSDPQLTINSLLDKYTQSEPFLLAKDDYGEIHKVWGITDQEAIKLIQKDMKKRDIFIADGHHRYETALNFQKWMKQKNVKCIEPESYNCRMITFVNMDDKGLTIFPSHRALNNITNFSLDNFLSQIKNDFHVREYPFKDETSKKRIQQELLEDLRIAGQTEHCFGLVLHNHTSFYLLSLKNEDIAIKKMSGSYSKAWKQLDVNILHNVILEQHLNLTKEKVESEKYITYTRYIEQTIEDTLKGRFQMSFLMNPTKVSEVREVAAKGERMPQKSTDFYPKLLSGLIGSKLNFA